MIGNTDLTIDLDVFRRYAGLQLPRHVSYPMPTWWKDMDESDAVRMRTLADERKDPHSLSLYVHIPFCQALCKFCACCRVIQRKTQPGADEKTEAYVAALETEIRKLGEQYSGEKKLRQVHWGGGTPTYLCERDIERLHKATAEAFDIAGDAEISIEVDPRVTTVDQFKLLRQLGFNRISLGVQDFEKQVQEHVKRIQPYDMVKATVDTCRELDFHSVNFDLIYGLPYQTMKSIDDTLDQVIALSPDRIAYYHYAQIPEKIATQVAIHHDQMPDSETKLQMFLLGKQKLCSAGYDFIGLDHFAKSEEMLAKASEDGTLQRNFQGMTTGGGLDLLGAGASSIGQINQIGFLQNVRDPKEYVEKMQTGETVIVKGKYFTVDDCIRQAVISEIYCTAGLRPKAIEVQYGIEFEKYFEREIGIMKELAKDGLVEIDKDNNLSIPFPLGRVLMRNVAAAFDAYLDPDAWRVGEQFCFSTNA